MKKKIIIIVVFVVIIAARFSFYPYLERHYITAHTDLEMKENIGENDTLIVYFTRLDNMEKDESVDAVSGASLMKDKNGELMGNTQAIAMTIQSIVHGDTFSIVTDKVYSSSYNENTNQAKEELDKDEIPELKTKINIDKYQTIYLVYPLWWNTIPQPVKAFLKSYDLSGKTLIPVASQGSRGFGDSKEDIQKNTKANVSQNGISIYCSDAKDCYEEIKEWLDGNNQ